MRPVHFRELGVLVPVGPLVATGADDVLAEVLPVDDLPGVPVPGVVHARVPLEMTFVGRLELERLTGADRDEVALRHCHRRLLLLLRHQWNGDGEDHQPNQNRLHLSHKVTPPLFCR
jgi:hypothetical protein